MLPLLQNSQILQPSGVCQTKKLRPRNFRYGFSDEVSQWMGGPPGGNFAHFEVKGGIPTAEDVLAAIDDLESLYRACAERGRLAGLVFDFMKEPLKFDDMNQISKKVKYQPPVVQVIGHDQFPV